MDLQRVSCGLEVKFASDSADQMIFEGYGAVFGNVDSYGDVIAPGAFAETLASTKASGHWPAMLLQHGGFLGGAEDMTPIGIWTDLVEDGTGLRVKGLLADTARGKEAYALLKMQPRPALTGLSIGFTPTEWTTRTKPEEPRRTLKKVQLWEVSLVTFPANGKARVSSVKGAGMTEREFESWLMRDAGLTRSEAIVVINDGFKTLKTMRDAGDGSDADTESLRRLLQSIKASAT